jgi:hypothetical protein
MSLKCHTCAHKRTIPGDCHLRCAKPCPSVKLEQQHGARWFMYPFNFDPVWGKGCTNYEKETTT